jgi:hypothetical protein
MVLLLFSVKVNEQKEHSGWPQSNEECAVVFFFYNKQIFGVEYNDHRHKENSHFPKGEFFKHRWWISVGYGVSTKYIPTLPLFLASISPRKVHVNLSLMRS